MATTKCPYCYREIFTRTNVCPKCERTLSIGPSAKKVSWGVWNPAVVDIKNEIGKLNQPHSNTWISCNKCRTDEDGDGDAGYYIFLLELDHWGRTPEISRKYKQALLDSVAKIERKCAEWNRKIGFNFSVEYWFEEK